MSRILVVEDDATIGSGLVTALRANGYEVDWARTGTDALDMSESEPHNLVLLDLGLPDLDGVEVCRRLRAAGFDVPVVMLTARREEIDVVLGLEAGADDYVTKPFRLAELLARVRAHLRRPRPETDAAADVVRIDDLEVNLGAHIASVAGDEVDLRPKEFDLLALLVLNAGRVVTRERIMTEVWDEHWFGSTKTLDTHISALRRKLDDDAPDTASRITTLRGVGYRLELR